MDTRMDKYTVVYQHSGMLDSKENEHTKTTSTGRMNLTNVMLRERSPSPTLSQRCLLRVHGTHLLQGLPLPWSPLPSFSAAPSSPGVSLCSPAPLPAGSLSCWTIHLLPPSLLESPWPCGHPHSGLHDFSCSSEHDFDVEAASCFLVSYKENFKLIYGTYHQEFVYLGALSGRIHGPLLSLLFPSSQWLLWVSFQ